MCKYDVSLEIELPIFFQPQKRTQTLTRDADSAQHSAWKSKGNNVCIYRLYIILVRSVVDTHQKHTKPKMSAPLPERKSATVVSRYIFTDKLIEADPARRTMVESQMKKMNNEWEETGRDKTKQVVITHPVQSAKIDSSSLLRLWTDYNPNPNESTDTVGWLNDNVCFSFSIKRNRSFATTCLGDQFRSRIDER